MQCLRTVKEPPPSSLAKQFFLIRFVPARSFQSGGSVSSGSPPCTKKLLFPSSELLCFPSSSEILPKGSVTLKTHKTSLLHRKMQARPRAEPMQEVNLSPLSGSGGPFSRPLPGYSGIHIPSFSFDPKLQFPPRYTLVTNGFV